MSATSSHKVVASVFLQSVQEILKVFARQQRQPLYITLYNEIKSAWRNRRSSVDRLFTIYERLRNDNPVFRSWTPAKPTSLFSVIASLQSAWANYVAANLENLEALLEFPARVIHYNYDKPKKIVKLYEQLNATTQDIVKDVCTIISEQVDDYDDTTRITAVTDDQTHDVKFFTTSSYVKSGVRAVRILCRSSIIEQLGDYINEGRDLNGVFTDAHLVRDLLLLFTVHRILYKASTSTSTIVDVDISIKLDNKDAKTTDYYEQLEEQITDGQAHHMKITITSDDSVETVKKAWNLLSRRHVYTGLEIDAPIFSDELATVYSSIIRKFVNRSPFLRRLRFSVMTPQHFINLFMQKAVRLESLNATFIQSQSSSTHIQELAFNNVAQFMHYADPTLKRLQVYLSKPSMPHFHRLLKNFPGLRSLSLHFKHSEHEDLTACLAALSTSALKLEQFTWSSRQSSDLNLEFYAHFQRFLLAQRQLKFVRINVGVYNPAKLASYVRATLDRSPLIVLDVDVSSETQDSLAIFRHLKANQSKFIEERTSGFA